MSVQPMSNVESLAFAALVGREEKAEFLESHEADIQAATAACIEVLRGLEGEPFTEVYAQGFLDAMELALAGAVALGVVTADMAIKAINTPTKETEE